MIIIDKQILFIVQKCSICTKKKQKEKNIKIYSLNFNETCHLENAS